MKPRVGDILFVKEAHTINFPPAKGRWPDLRNEWAVVDWVEHEDGNENYRVTWLTTSGYDEDGELIPWVSEAIDAFKVVPPEKVPKKVKAALAAYRLTGEV